MPANMIIDAVGSTCAVSGSSIATVSAGPMPGSTPTAVPTMQPTKAHSRLMGVAAVAKPCMSWFRMSMPASSDPAALDQGRQRHAEHLGEEPEDRRADEGSDDEVL